MCIYIEKSSRFVFGKALNPISLLSAGFALVPSLSKSVLHKYMGCYDFRAQPPRVEPNREGSARPPSSSGDSLSAIPRLIVENGLSRRCL
jgi:hypothetical protein